jgi:outer membrane biosynthesis protein TonB
MQQVRVLPGDTLYEIAESEYGDGRRWKEIADANGIEDPRDLQPWQVLLVPGKSSGFRGPVRRPSGVKPAEVDEPVEPLSPSPTPIGRPTRKPEGPARPEGPQKTPIGRPTPKPARPEAPQKTPIGRPTPRPARPEAPVKTPIARPTANPETPARDASPTFGPATRKPAAPARAPKSSPAAAPYHPPAMQQAGERSPAWQSGYRIALRRIDAALDRIAQDGRTRGAIERAAQETGISVDDLTAMAVIESGGDRAIGTNKFGYTGLMQMGKDAATDVGMSFASMKGADNVDNNALGGAKYWKTNDKRLNKDIPRTPLHMYLAHQQGAGGTNKLWKTLGANPDAAANGNQMNNLPESVRKQVGPHVSQQEFYDYWAGNMAAIEQRIAERKAT